LLPQHNLLHDVMADAKEALHLTGSVKGFRSNFSLIRNRLTQALPQYHEGPTTSHRRTIEECLEKIRPAYEKVHNTYQRLLGMDHNKAHGTIYSDRQNLTGTEFNTVMATAEQLPIRTFLSELSRIFWD
jgi:hypothetical protein